MKFIVDISEDTYNFIKCYGFMPESYLNDIGKAIYESSVMPRGEWIWRKNGCFSCSECRALESAQKNFCSNCGADMQGVHNG